MNLVIAEKPSVALSIAKVIGAKNKKDGYYEGNGYRVSWCVGHLIEMSYPEKYDEKYKKWKMEDLPFLPKNYKYQVGENPLSYAPNVSGDYTLHGLDGVGYRYTYKKNIEKKLDGTKEVLVFTNNRDPIPPMGVVGLGEIWRRNLLLLSLVIGAIIIMKKRKLILRTEDCDK